MRCDICRDKPCVHWPYPIIKDTIYDSQGRLIGILFAHYDSEAQQLAAEIAYELFEFWQMRARREHQWRRLRTRHGVHIIKLCNPGNSIQTWDRVKGALRRRGCPKFQKV